MIYHVNYPDDEGIKYERFTYPAGETQIRMLQTETNPAIRLCTRASELWITARIRDGEIMNLALLVDAMRSVRPTPLSIVLPYLPFSRADREFVDGDCCGLGVFGSQLNALGATSIVTIDCHNEKPANYFINNLKNISPLPLIEQILKEIPSPITILLPDDGAARYGIEKLGHKVLKCKKKRNLKTGVFEGFEVPAYHEFDTKNVLIVDDICDGGGTFIGIADKMKEYELNLYLYVTHGIFSKGTKELFKRFISIYTTNTFQPRYEDSAIQMIPFEGLNIFGG